jgi:hypothetical protein
MDIVAAGDGYERDIQFPRGNQTGVTFMAEKMRVDGVSIV